MRLIETIIAPFVKRRVSEVIASELTRRIPHMVDDIMRERFASNSNRTLTSTGFLWALVLALEKAWPYMGRDAAISCAKDCLEVPYGTSGYDWTAASAHELVRDYVATHSEYPS